MARPSIAGRGGLSGWLYIHVAPRTVVAPTTNDGVMEKWKRATEARKEMMILRDVANPFMILSEYYRPCYTRIGNYNGGYSP